MFFLKGFAFRLRSSASGVFCMVCMVGAPGRGRCAEHLAEHRSDAPHLAEVSAHQVSQSLLGYGLLCYKTGVVLMILHHSWFEAGPFAGWTDCCSSSDSS